ncbi:glycoside hydrolase family 88 protein [Pelagicoccus sp. SDUM812003]|uniref:glycoside hydrolase family 88/105 protein n=1 Tax=Pelagicoccus sp. SDUM812003 TaxID=3041267 RepID=UPI00280DDF16|nr:glycoside hydrolase family 88 protein [Pelagicoccus sp. SDUM812003]MDQ8201954.1 glycoside hydrolase family 88 protein [Pelagicoccus sp. SDUM812003]
MRALSRFAPPLLCLVAFASHVQDTRAGQTINTGALLVDNLLQREDYMRYGEHGLHYAEACAAIGAMRFCSATEDRARLEAIASRYQKLLEPGSDLISAEPHVDFSVIGAIPLQAYLSTGDKTQRAFGLRFADRQWEDPLPSGLTSETRWWIDDMYMVGLLQMQAFRATEDPTYADRAARFLHAYLSRLQQENGLFHHGPDAPFLWGRGNGWCASALAEVLSSLPETHPLFPEILARYRTMMRSLLDYQQVSGMWTQLIDRPDSWEESSCTAMFAYAMQVGINHGWLDAHAYQAPVDKAWTSLLRRLDEQGDLQDICVGTGQSKDASYYLNRPRHSGDFHGQAPMLWLATQRLKIRP